MTIARKERPQGAPTPKGPSIKLVQSTGKADMNSVPQAGSSAIERGELARKLVQISELACYGEAIADALSLEGTIKALKVEQMQLAIMDLSRKFEAIKEELDTIHLL